MACTLLSVIYSVFQLWYQVFDSISICSICNNDSEEDILHSNMISSQQNLAYSFVCVTYQTPDT